MQPTTFALLVALAAAGCGRAVGPDPIAPDAGASSPPPAATCDEVRAACDRGGQMLVRGHATGLDGLDGATAEFAVRYSGPYGSMGVASASTEVHDGALEACVCIPRYGASDYPAIAAVVFRPGSAGATGGDVARAAYSQRYATLGDEDVGAYLDAAPSPLAAEVALAAVSSRTATMNLVGLGAASEGHHVFAGVVADERPIAAQVVQPVVSGGEASLVWAMPGRAWPSDRVALFEDVDGDGRCGAADRGAVVPLDDGADVDAGTIHWVEGAGLDAICRAAALDQARGG